MPKEKMPPRPWSVDDLLDLGQREKVTYLKAIPLLILERWVLGEREEGAANYVWTKVLAKRLVDSKLHRPFKPKATSNILGAIGAIQRDRNLTRPWLTESSRGFARVNLPYYEGLLQDYREQYKSQLPADYAKLF